MILSSSTLNLFQVNHTPVGASLVCSSVSSDPTHNQDYIQISENEAFPTSYVLDNLRRVGPYLFNNQYSSDSCLHIEDSLNNEAHFWLHDFYFAQDCQLLYRLLCRFPRRSSISNELEMTVEKRVEVEQDQQRMVRHIYIKVPSIVGFEEILRWIYTRDDEQWLSTFDEENFETIMQNVAFLRLGHEAYYVLAQFYENL
ncbi:hypothetical protein K493DRAFT_18529 [Basidiobolus meristosporus CBS 931.73]|uniref:BTB domain-containing protein n=1 Tax=Basidiobolus meristosporus CBS 931.73 TaxID=1314790 RepID=A0A1Y1Z918_9FUNG|nr:hypothetical protein K493DRAFT_18529 [Basidiobolus meristosporus CBS 931.73]|eukprot:ORY06604.1 hypothetical protein K493DRAFT_18529 [Basidiobolus meristosporus CBS 931.73]